MTEKLDQRLVGFEAEVASLEEFFRLLELREVEEHNRQAVDERYVPRQIRRAIYLSQLHDVNYGKWSVPFVTRYVVAAFAYGDDLVTFRVTTSRNAEWGKDHEQMTGKRHPKEAQQEFFEELRSDIRKKLDEVGAALPILEGYFHHSSNPRREKDGP